MVYLPTYCGLAYLTMLCNSPLHAQFPRKNMAVKDRINVLACLPAPPALRTGLSPAPRPPPGSPLRHSPCRLRRRTPNRRMCPEVVTKERHEHTCLAMVNNGCVAACKEKDLSCREHMMPSACPACCRYSPTFCIPASTDPTLPPTSFPPALG